MSNLKNLKKKRDGLAYLLGISTLNYIDTRLQGVDEAKAKEKHGKEIDMLIKQYERLLNEVGNQSEKD